MTDHTPTPSSIGIADMTVALQIRKRQASKRRAKYAAIFALIFAMAGAAIWALLFSDWLTVHKVEVKGNTLCPVEMIIQAAEIDLGTPMARVQLDEAASRIESIPAVSQVTLSRSWPNTITIEVSERTVSVQRLDNGVYQWISSDGIIFNATTEPASVPVVRSASTDQQLMADAAKVAQALPAPVLARLIEIHAAGRDTIVIQLEAGVQIIWGSADESELKADVIVALMQVPGSVYDVSAPGFPTVR